MLAWAGWGVQPRPRRCSPLQLQALAWAAWAAVSLATAARRPLPLLDRLQEQALVRTIMVLLPMGACTTAAWAAWVEAWLEASTFTATVLLTLMQVIPMATGKGIVSCRLLQRGHLTLSLAATGMLVPQVQMQGQAPSSLRPLRSGLREEGAMAQVTTLLVGNILTRIMLLPLLLALLVLTQGPSRGTTTCQRGQGQGQLRLLQGMRG